MDFFNSFIKTLDIAPNLAGDISLLLLFIGVSIGLGFFLGRSRLISILIDIYIARALVAILPASWLAFSPFGGVIVFVLLFLFLFVVDRRLFDLHLSNASTDFFWRVLVTGVLVTGLLVSSVLYFLPQKLALSLISASVYGYFASATALALWMIVPLVGLLFINNRLK
jgi:small-conductance mechanosensitive channel